MSLDTFLNRVAKYQEKKVKVLKKDIEGFGEIEFSRPSESVLIDYLEAITKEANFDINDEKKVKAQDIPIMKLAKESSKLVYLSCVDLRSKELREQFPATLEHYDIPLDIFGMNTIMELATFISNGFGAVKAKEQVEEAIKN